MGSIDIPPFLREKQKQKVQAGTTGSIPPFLKKKEDEIVSETTGEDLLTGTEDISIQQSNLVTESPFDFKRQIPRDVSMPANLKPIAEAKKNIHFGTITEKQLSDLQQNEFTRKMTNEVIKQYVPEVTDETIDNPKTIALATRKIKEANRINFVNAEKEGINQLDNSISSVISDFNKPLPANKAGRMTDYIDELRVAVNIDDPNNNDKISDAIQKIKKIDNLEQSYLINQKEKSESREKNQSILTALNNRLNFNISRKGVTETINQLNDQIDQAVISKVMESERGEPVADSNRDKVKVSQFKLGLTAVEKTDPILFKNVVNAIAAEKKVSDTDFNNIANVGQQIDNTMRLRGGAYDPSLIDTETSFDYTTFGQKKAQAAMLIGEWAKEKGYKNITELPERIIRQGAKEKGVDNKEIVNSLVFDEKLLLYDAIPKAGWLDDVASGIMQPLQGINSTLNSWDESPAQTYLRSKSFEPEIGTQKVPDEKGQFSDVLPSERGRFLTDMFRGLGQFIPQVLLTKGVGAGLRGTAGLTGATISGGQARNISDLGGTFVSTFLQSYGPSYEEHLQKTGDANTAALVGTIDGISSGGFELFLPDVRLAGKAFDGLKRGLSTDLAGLIKKGGDPGELVSKARPFVQKFFKNATNILGQETSEELGTQYVDFVTESIFDPASAKERNLNKELWDTFKSTTAAMLIPSILGAGGSSFQKDFTTKSLHSAAINFDSYKESLQNSLDKGYIDQDGFNKAVQLLSTHKQSIAGTPEVNANGSELSTRQKLDYALEDTKIKVYNDKASKSEGIAKEMWESKIKQAEDIQREILIPKEDGKIKIESLEELNARISKQTPEESITEETTVELTPESETSDAMGKEEIKAAKVLAKAGLPDVYKGMAETDPVSVLKDIAKQAQNLNEDFVPHNDGKEVESLERAKEYFGEYVVNEAIKLYQPKTQTNETTQTQTTPEAETSVLTETKTTAEPPVSSVENKGVLGELKIEDKTRDVLDEVTDEKIGEKKYQDFSIDFEDGATAFGRIEDGVAKVSGISAAKKEGSVIEPKRGTKVYDRLINKLWEAGIKKIRVGNQSSDSQKALEKLVEKGIIKPINEFNKTFEIIPPKAAKEKSGKPVSSVEGGEVGVKENNIGSNRDFDDRIEYTLGGGKLVIGKVEGTNRYSVLELNVEEGQRRKGIASKLMQKAIEKTNGLISGQASNDNAVELNYKLGMRAYEKGKELSLSETKDLRKKQSSVRMIISTKEVENKKYEINQNRKEELDEIKKNNDVGNKENKRERQLVESFIKNADEYFNNPSTERKIYFNTKILDSVRKGVRAALLSKNYDEARKLTMSYEELVNEKYDKQINDLTLSQQSQPKGEAAKQPATKKESDEKVSNPPKEKPADEGKVAETGEATKEGKTISQKGKELADRIRQLKSKRDVLQANIFGIPIAIYDGALEVVATAIEAGAELAQAIQDGIKYIRDKGGNDLDEAAFTSHINDVSEGVKPKVKVQVGEPEGTKKDNKAVIGRLMKSENVPDEVKEIFKENDLKYKVRSQAEARKIGNAVIESFGIDEAVLLAEAGKFHGDVNSMIFALSLDRMYEAEQAATTPEAKQEAAEQYADIAMRYQDAAESGGRFISAINDFYKKSPAGLVIKAEKEFQRRQDEYFEGREKPTKEAWQEFINTVEGKELLQEELEKIKPKKKKIFTPDTEAKIKNFFSKLKINTKGQAGSYLIPPQIYNAAIDVIENAVLAGVSIGKAIEQAVEYIGDNYKEAWKVKEFKKDIRDGFKKQNVQRVLSTEDRENILKKWNKKLIGLNQEQKNTLLNKAFLELIDNGALEYDQFKQLYAEALGLPQMTPELAAQLKELATKINEPSKIKDEILKTKSPELISKYRDAVKDAEIAATKLNDLIGKQKWWLNTFLTVMRLNTLGAVSLVGNIAYNVAALPVRFAVNLTATGIDYLLAGAQLTSDKVFGTSLYTNPPTHNVFKIQGGFLRGLWLGTTTSIKQFFTGLSNRDYFQKEIKQNIKPLTSAKKFIRGMTGKQKLTLNEKLNSFIEAFPTMGMSAEVIARALNIGDKGFRFAAEYAKAEQLGQQKGLKGIDKEIFILFPDEESEQKIREAGEKIVFQQKNVVTKALDSAGTAISNAVKKQGGEAKLLHGIAKTLGYASQPFLNTPLNVFNEFIHYAFPPLPLYRAGKAMVQGDSEKAVYHLSQAVVGLSIGYAATQLVAQGLITGSGDDDEAKERAGIQAFQRQGQINLSGLKRLLAGSYDGVEDDDTWVDLKYYGFMGMLLLSKASQYKGKTKEQIEGETYFQDVVGQFVPAVKTGLTEGVFSGTSSLLNAISMGGRYTDNWVLGMGNVFVNAFEPNWLRSLSMTNNDYIRDTRDMSLSQEAKNQLKNRFFSGKDLPSKIDIWGERIESVPVGSNRYMYNIMGLNKKNIFDNDQFGYALYDYYNQTKNYNIFPPVLKREVNNQALTPEQYEQFSILVGSHRRQLINPLIQSGKFEKLKGEGVESVTKELDKKYDEARKLGVKEFENIYPEFKLKKKK